jgi:hypothetical protein
MPGNAGLPSGGGQSLTAEVLASRAAAAALSGPVVSPGQWVYRNYAVVAAPGNASSPVIAERWATADYTAAAAYVGGQLEVGPWMWPVDPHGQIRKRPLMQPAVSYGSLSSLPGTPGELVALLARTPVPRAPQWRAGHAFELIAELFQSYVVPPDTAARLYRALAAISGVTTDVHAIDVAGHHGIGFLLADAGAGGNQEIIVNPRTCRFQGYQFLGHGQDIHAGGAWGMAIFRQALVSAPGVRPPGQPKPSNP